MNIQTMRDRATISGQVDGRLLDACFYGSISGIFALHTGKETDLPATRYVERVKETLSAYETLRKEVSL